MWREQAGMLVYPRRRPRKECQNEESQSQGHPPKTPITELEHRESPFLKE
jgi:hypothetical protein